MGDGDAFGLSGGARGVDDVGGGGGIDAAGQGGGGWPSMCGAVGIEVDDAGAVLRQVLIAALAG